MSRGTLCLAVSSAYAETPPVLGRHSRRSGLRISPYAGLRRGAVARGSRPPRQRDRGRTRFRERYGACSSRPRVPQAVSPSRAPGIRRSSAAEVTRDGANYPFPMVHLVRRGANSRAFPRLVSGYTFQPRARPPVCAQLAGGPLGCRSSRGERCHDHAGVSAAISSELDTSYAKPVTCVLLELPSSRLSEL